MTIEQPPRLVHEEPEFARLIAASNKQMPPIEQFEKALSLAEEIAATSRSTSWRLLGAKLAIALAVMGATAVGSVAVVGWSRSEDSIVVAAEQPRVVIMPARESNDDSAHTPNAEVPTSVVTVSVDDLATVPPPSVSVKHPSATKGAVYALRIDAGAPSLAPPRKPDSELGATRASFGEELALVATARSALERGDIASCARAVGLYRERFGSGTFAHEIEVIRIEMLFASGQSSQARAAAERFLTLHQTSPYVDRVRSLLEQSRH